MNDDNEIIELSCDKCKMSKSGTYKELFGNLPSLNWKLRWLCRWEVLKLDITEKWYWLFPKSS